VHAHAHAYATCACARFYAHALWPQATKFNYGNTVINNNNIRERSENEPTLDGV